MSKTAIVLAGGGFTGIMYELGALHALDDLMADQRVTDFDIYVGTSAGALVSAGLANGFSPDLMVQAVGGKVDSVPAVNWRDFLHLNRRELFYRIAIWPFVILRLWINFLRSWREMTLFDLGWSLLDALPIGIYDNMLPAKYVKMMLGGLGGSDRFEDLERELYLVATNLENGERAVFSQKQMSHVPISEAVTASSAVPILYEPRLIDGVEYVDGGVRSNASLDLAIENGAKLIVCVNPLVPTDYSQQSAQRASRWHFGRSPARVSKQGAQTIANQVFRIFAHAGLHYHVKQLRRAYPDVDIVIIEPQPDDKRMHVHNVMRFSARQLIYRHGYETVTLDLARNYENFDETFAKHGIYFNDRFLNTELAALRAAEYAPQTLRDLLQQRSL